MLTYLAVKNFRNHLDFKLNINNQILVLEGENGAGKTSLLEAIYFTATTKSHRTNKDKDLIKEGKEFARINLKNDKDEFLMVISLNGKKAFINNQEVRKLSSYIGNLNVVLFAPEDLDLIKGSPSIRRNFLDLELVQMSKEYLDHLSNYKNILKQRNILLKKIKLNDDFTFLNILGEQLYKFGIQIYDYRNNFINELNKILIEVSKEFDDFIIQLKYMPNVSKDNWLNILMKKQQNDINLGQTLFGIHKDDFDILFNNKSLKDYGSQGMIRLAAILIKLSLLKWLEEKTNKKVLLLLDDVFSELDLNIQNKFIEMLPKDIQTIITSAIPLKNKDFQKINLDKRRQDAK